MATKKQGKNNKRRQAIVRIVFMALILICVNILASYFHKGIDLTKEKRFTLSNSTKKMLRSMPEVAVINVYLKGKLPADLQHVQESVREELSTFKDVAGNKIIYRFIDPFEGKNENEQKQIARDLQLKGIELMSLPSKEEDGYSVKVCFPYALVQYNGREMPIYLLENAQGKTRSELTMLSAALLEYKFASAINMMSKAIQPRIGYLYGNGEDMSIHSVDLLSSLGGLYKLDSLNLSHMIHISNAYDAIIINAPTTPFSEPDKLKIDQYIMRGGHVLWAVNTMSASMDSFSHGNQKFLSVENGLNLDDMLFKYGARINNDLIEDKQCVPIPIMATTGKPELHDWVYFPRINPTADHPIVRNMDFIIGGFTNSIDTISAAAIKSTVLLETSKYSRTSSSPVTVSFTKINYPGRMENFNKPYRPVAVLLEGKFVSLYKNRLARAYLATLDSLNEPFKPQCDSTGSMIVTSIGNIFQNDFSTKDGPMQLGYYKYTAEHFANRDFLLNAIEYLTDRSGILEARSKDVKMRLLDKGRAIEEKTQWQWINVAVPIALVLMFASFYLFMRKRRYEVKKTIKPTTNG